MTIGRKPPSRPPVPLWLWPLAFLWPLFLTVALCRTYDVKAAMILWGGQSGYLPWLPGHEPNFQPPSVAAAKLALIVGPFAGLCLIGGLALATKFFESLIARIFGSFFFAPPVAAASAAIYCAGHLCVVLILP